MVFVRRWKSFSFVTDSSPFFDRFKLCFCCLQCTCRRRRLYLKRLPTSPSSCRSVVKLTQSPLSLATEGQEGLVTTFPDSDPAGLLELLGQQVLVLLSNGEPAC
ncbi:hypothetical protein VULLAG_LOCUS15210 [Vulpes lagopus]